MGKRLISLAIQPGIGMDGYNQRFYSNYYKQSVSAQKLIELTLDYQFYCKHEELTPVYTVNDVKLAIDDDCVDQGMINHFMTFSAKSENSP